MARLKRRDFLITSTWAATGAAAVARGGVSPNEVVRVAVLGCGRGGSLARMFSKVPDSQVVAICDVDESRSATLCNAIEKRFGKRPEQVVDFRTLLDRDDIDALAVATPEHWHAPVTILACMAGKDVYVEKPCSHTIFEGRQMIRAAERFGRIVQHGTQLRSVPHYEEAWQLLRDGVIGDVKMVKAINNQRRRTYKHLPNESPPAGVHFDLWLGPAPQRSFNRNRFHGVWRWYWDYGGGDITNDGVHQIDIGRWALDLGAPNAVSCSAAKLGSRGDPQETPDTMVVTWEYDDLLYVYEQRDFTPYRMRGHRQDNDNIIYGTDGFMMVDRAGYRVFYKDRAGPTAGKPWQESEHFYQNFIDCVKSRKREDQIADIQEGHLSSLLCHLANISYRTGRRLEFDADSETFRHDDDANQYVSKEYRKGFELPEI